MIGDFANRLRRHARIEHGLIATALALALVGVSPSSHAAEAPDAARAWQWDGIYKADLLHSRAVDSGVGNLGLHLNADAGALLGWDDTTLHGELLWNHGGKPNRRI